jgi:hypothetical protein
MFGNLVPRLARKYDYPNQEKPMTTRKRKPARRTTSHRKPGAKRLPSLKDLALHAIYGLTSKEVAKAFHITEDEADDLIDELETEVAFSDINDDTSPRDVRKEDDLVYPAPR